MTFSNRTFGIEIEAYNVPQRIVADALRAAGIDCHAEGYNHLTRPHWKVIGDASLHGNDTFELVSPILQGQNGLDQIETVCRVLKTLNAKVNKSCGLHVHHGAADLSIKGWKDLCRLYAKHELALDTVMAPSRRGNSNHMLRSLVGTHITVSQAWAAVAGAKTLNDLAEKFTYSGRYYKLNLTAFARHSTVEFRHHQGTVEAEKIVNWVKLTQAMVERAHQGNKTGLFLERNQRHQGGTLEGLFNAIKAHTTPEVIAFYRARAKHFQGRTRAAA